MSEQSTQEKQKPENNDEARPLSEDTPVNTEPTAAADGAATDGAAAPEVETAESLAERLPKKLDDEQKAFVEQLAQDLGESQAIPLRLLHELVRVCGVDFAKSVFEETFKVEANGGLMTNNGQRRRTTGGVFFYIARGRMSKAEESIVYAAQQRKKRNLGAHKPNFDFEKRSPLYGSRAYGKGVADSVRVTIIGRPGKVNHFRDMVVLTMVHDANDPSLPAGIPTPPAERTVYTVYMAFNQWNKLAPQIKDETKALMIEGVLAYDEKLESMAVYATKAITRNHKPRDDADETIVNKRIKPDARPTPKASPDKSGGKNARGEKGGTNGSRDAKQAISSRPAPVIPETIAPEMPDHNIPASAPPDVAAKLKTLHIAAQQYRLKISALEEKPEDKRFGLDMTKKLLANTERQISELEAKYSS